MKNFLQKNPEIVLVTVWFLLIFTITMFVLWNGIETNGKVEAKNK